MVAGLLPLRSEFNIGPDHVRFVVDKVALGDVLVRVLRLSPVSTIPPRPHTHLLLHVALTRQTKERKQRTLQKSNALAHVGGPLGIESCFILISRPLRKRIDFLAFLKPFNGIIVDTKR
jgi:hypothetical protein